MVSKSQGRAAACIAAAILVVNAGFQFYWGAGGTWARGADPEGLGQIDRAIIGLLSAVYAAVLLVRVGYWREHIPSAATRFVGAQGWLIAIVPLGGALHAFAVSDPVGGLIDLILAALAFVAVRSAPPVSPTIGQRQFPSGKAGPSSSAQ